MFQLAGRVVALERCRDQYAILELRREQSGLLGATMRVLLPPLVLVRDGEPQVGSQVEIGAQSLAEAGLARRDWDCLLVARYIDAVDGRSGTAAEAATPPLRAADGGG